MILLFIGTKPPCGELDRKLSLALGEIARLAARAIETVENPNCIGMIQGLCPPFKLAAFPLPSVY